MLTGPGMVQERPMAETKTKPTGASVDAYLFARASPQDCLTAGRSWPFAGALRSGNQRGGGHRWIKLVCAYWRRSKT